MKKYFLLMGLFFGCSHTTTTDPSGVPGYTFFGNGVIIGNTKDKDNDTICYCALYTKPSDSLGHRHGNLMLTSGVIHPSKYGYQPPSGTFWYCYCDHSSNTATGWFDESPDESLIWDETKADYKKGYVKIISERFMSAYIYLQ